MKGLLLSVGTLVVMGLHGCASDSHKMTSRSNYSGDVDYAKMAAITQDARSRGYDIVWINPPLKDKPPKTP